MAITLRSRTRPQIARHLTEAGEAGQPSTSHLSSDPANQIDGSEAGEIHRELQSGACHEQQQGYQRMVQITQVACNAIAGP